MSTTVAELNENCELENVLQQMFMECEASMSMSTSPGSTASMGEDIPVFKIIEYIKEQLLDWSVKDLVELCKCLVAASTNEHVNLQQFKQATKCWIAKVQQAPSLQDDNNNARKTVYIVNNADPSMKMDMDKDVVEMELRMKLRELNEENILLRDELERHEATIENLKLQCNISKKQLDRYLQKCQQLEKENDEQRAKLNEAVTNEMTLTLTLRTSTKDYKDLLEQLEAAEIEMQAIPSLKDKVEKINKEKVYCLKHITKLQEEVDEREDECKQLKATVAELKDTSVSMRETYEYTIRNLREKNRQLVDENTELQSLSIINGERYLSISDTDECCTHSTPYKPEKVEWRDSLYAELKASGFDATDCSKNGSCRLELEGELEQYDAAISAILEQLEKVASAFVAARGSSDDVPQLDSQDAPLSAKPCNIEALERKVASLLHMATAGTTRTSTEDASTQVRTDSACTSEDLHGFGVTSFHDAVTRAQLCLEPKTNPWSIVSQCTNNEEDSDSNPFLRVIKAYDASVDANTRIIDPIVKELNEIIEGTLNSLVSRKDHRAANGNSRYRSIHTLPSNSQTLVPSSSSSTEHSSYQSLSRNSPDVPLAQRDGLKREGNRSENNTTAKHDTANQEQLVRLTEDSSREMPKVSNILPVDSEAFKLASNEMDSKGFQVPEVSSASNPTSPRRKISVYCRSFDVVAMLDSRDPRGSSDLAVGRSMNSSVVRAYGGIDETGVKDENSTFKYQFDQNYRNVRNDFLDTDSSNDSTPRKQLQDSLLEDEPLIVQTIPRKVHLAPTRLKLPQEAKKDESSETISSVFSAVNGHEEENDDAYVHSSATFVVDKGDTLDSVLLDTELRSANKDFFREQLEPVYLNPCDQSSDSAKFADSGDPHSRASVSSAGSESEPRVGRRSVDNQMSSREGSSVGSDSECETAATGSGDGCVGGKFANGAKAEKAASASALSRGATFARVVPHEKDARNDEEAHDKSVKQKRRQQRVLIIRRSFSEGENQCRPVCHCGQNGGVQGSTPIQRENQSRVFPSLTDVRLQESGIANLSDGELSNKENLNELELQKRYIAFSLCLCTDRVTLPRRVAMSLRQRDQSERNLSNEVQKMQQDIQDLAPLCTDRESVERVERVRHQLGMIARCAHRVSCAAETLGAVHQELRVSRAVLLADRYLQVLQSRCEKLATNIAETKRILIENNIVIEENTAELGDDLPRIRYRSGTPANNRIMMARRRASVATMSRPIGTQDVMKETARQRNSVSGRMTTLRRPSLSSESPKWEIEKLNRTDSSNSATELRGIFEQAESRRNSREENNNMLLRLSHCNSKSLINCTVVDEAWPSDEKQETSPEHLTCVENTDPDCDGSLLKSSRILCLRKISWRMMLWGILIFFLGFFVNQTLSVGNMCNVGSSDAWSIEEFLSRYLQRNAGPSPL